MIEARVKMLPEAADDVRRLDGSARAHVLRGLNKLRTDPHLRGAPLGSRATGNLTGLRKLVVGDRTCRIVYDVRSDGTVVVVWVVGPRAGGEVYETAKARLDQYEGDPARKAILTQILDTAFE